VVSIDDNAHWSAWHSWPSLSLFLHAYEVLHGHPFLRTLKAEDGLSVLAGLTCVIVLPYLAGASVARLFCRSRIRFYRVYRHQ